MYPHRIRLRGPWDYEPVSRAGGDGSPLPPPGRTAVPARWADGGLPGFGGEVRYRRRFGYPGQIDSYERVWLTFEGVSRSARVTLNGTALVDSLPSRGGEFDVTALLRPRNELEVLVEGGRDGGLSGEVALEVRASAWLRNVVLARDGDEILVSGEVVGSSEGELELYLVLDRSPAGYQTVRAAEPGQRFEFRANASVGGDGEPASVAKIELVQGAVAWYTMEVPLSARAARRPGA